MRILVLGGTQFIGRHIVAALLAAGHEVTILTRGVSTDELPAEVERLRGDRDLGVPGLAALTGRTWDTCVDVSGYTARQVRASTNLLRSSVGRYVYMSTMSVYGDPESCPVRETDPLMPPAAEDVTEVNGETYGPLKVTCENIVRETFGERCAMLRPQVVVGPHDHTGRYAFWQQRALRGREMLAPGDGSDHIQVIDVRDLARFTTVVVENGLGGSFNLAGPRLTWAEFMSVIGAENLVWVSAAIIKSEGLAFYELPLFRPDGSARSGLMDVSNEKARAAGLMLTDPTVTAFDTQVFSMAADLTGALSPQREAELLAVARAQEAN
jgi:2'-hydroxyisoflavone reductase